MRLSSIIILPLLILGCATPPAPVSVIGESESELVYADLVEQLDRLYPRGSTVFRIAYNKTEAPTPIEAGIGQYLRLHGYACQDSTEIEASDLSEELRPISLSFNQLHGEETEIIIVTVGDKSKLIFAYSPDNKGQPRLIGITQELLEHDQS